MANTVSSTMGRSGRNSAFPALPSQVWPSGSRTAAWRPATRPFPVVRFRMASSLRCVASSRLTARCGPAGEADGRAGVTEADGGADAGGGATASGVDGGAERAALVDGAAAPSAPERAPAAVDPRAGEEGSADTWAGEGPESGRLADTGSADTLGPGGASDGPALHAGEAVAVVAVAAAGSAPPATADLSLTETHETNRLIELARSSRGMPAPDGRRACHGVTGADGTPWADVARVRPDCVEVHSPERTRLAGRQLLPRPRGQAGGPSHPPLVARRLRYTQPR